MVTTHDQVLTARQHAVRTLHQLLADKEGVIINELIDPEHKEKLLGSINKELIRTQDILDNAPEDQADPELSKK